MALSLGNLGFANGQNGGTNGQTSLANAAIDNTDSNIAMNDFTATSVDSIDGFNTIDVAETNFYEVQFSGDSSRFDVIADRDRNFAWSSEDTNVLSVDLGK